MSVMTRFLSVSLLRLLRGVIRPAISTRCGLSEILSLTEIPRLQPQFLSGLDRYKCAVGYDEQGCDVPHRCIRSANLRAAASVWTELRVSKRVNSKEAERSAVVRPFGQVGVALHDRRGRPDTQLYTQLPIDILGQTSGSADNPMGSLAGNGVAGQAERMLGALIA